MSGGCGSDAPSVESSIRVLGVETVRRTFDTSAPHLGERQVPLLYTYIIIIVINRAVDPDPQSKLK